MTYEETMRRASDALDDISLAIARKRRVYNKYIRHGAVSAASELAEEIASMEAELEGEQEMFRIAFY